MPEYGTARANTRASTADPVVPEAVCIGQLAPATTDGPHETCRALLIRLPAVDQQGQDQWLHLHDRCEQCWDTTPPAFTDCKDAHLHDTTARCSGADPLVCRACGSVVNPEMAIGGHEHCTGAMGRCCGCCGGGAWQDVDPDALHDAAVDHQLGGDR